MLTTIIKTNNSEDTISEVLESVKDLGEIVVIDEHSTDDTNLLSKEYKAHIIYSNPMEFNSAFENALNETQNDWILLLEGDEIIPDKLGQKILNYIESPKKNKNAVILSKKHFYLDKEIKSARKKEIKLFKKDSVELKNNYSLSLKPLKTKKYKLQGSFKNDKDCILKFEKKNIPSILQNTLNEITIKAKESNSFSSSVFIKPLFKFISIYLLKGAIFQGRLGFMYSFYEAVKIFIFESIKFEKKVNNAK